MTFLNLIRLLASMSSKPASDTSSVAAPARVAAPTRGTTPLRLPQEAEGRPHTLHVEYAVWSSTYRIIHTRPNGSRQVWRRGIEDHDEAILRARYVADMLGYEARL